MSQTAEIPFLSKNLRRGEEILLTVSPPKSKKIAMSFFKDTVIPFPFAWLWGAIDLGVLFGVPIGMSGTEDSYVIFIIIPFILVHATPFWIYLYNVIANIRDAKSRGYILTTQRILFRMARKQPFTSVELSQIESVQITDTSKISWQNIHLSMKANYFVKEGKTESSSFNLVGLSKNDVARMYEFLDAILEDFRRLEKKGKYRAICLSCGGRTKDGCCMYCGTQAERVKEDVKNITEKETKISAKKELERKKKIEDRIIEIQNQNKQTISELISRTKNMR